MPEDGRSARGGAMGTRSLVGVLATGLVLAPVGVHAGPAAARSVEAGTRDGAVAPTTETAAPGTETEAGTTPDEPATEPSPDATPSDATPSEAAATSGSATAPAPDDVEALRQAYAAAPAGPSGDATRASLLLEIARAERRAYDVDGEPKHLRTAKAAMQQHLAQLEVLGPVDATHRAAVEREIAAIDTALFQHDGAGPPPLARPPAPVATGPVLPPLPALPPPDTSDLQRRQRTGQNLVTAGLVVGGLGLASLVLVALPAYGLAARAERRAASEPLLVSEQELYERADTRRRVGLAALIVGGSGVLIGGALAGAGWGTKAKIERERRAGVVAVGPWLSPEELGGGLTLRF